MHNFPLNLTKSALLVHRFEISVSPVALPYGCPQPRHLSSDLSFITNLLPISSSSSSFAGSVTLSVTLISVLSYAESRALILGSKFESGIGIFSAVCSSLKMADSPRLRPFALNSEREREDSQFSRTEALLYCCTSRKDPVNNGVE